MSLIERIRSRDATVGVIGLGYVGLPLAVELAHAGFKPSASTWWKKKCAASTRATATSRTFRPTCMAEW